MAKIVTDYLELRGVKISVSAKASPWQNGYKESFFGHFKDEFGDINRFETSGALIEEIYGQIHYYNFDRIHRSLKMSPVKLPPSIIQTIVFMKWGLDRLYSHSLINILEQYAFSIILFIKIHNISCPQRIHKRIKNIF